MPLRMTSSDIMLSIDGISKKFCRSLKRSLFYGVQDISLELLGLRDTSEKLRPEEFWALHNVSFTLRRKEALGLVGKNGSGKTTLLRIISGLIRPDTGRVTIKGRVAPLIALSAGFNPILTGRENIYANMSILGLSKVEIDDRFQDVVDFADIGDAIDAPVSSYSSGMSARLGFACAVYTDPDILLIDEVLAVGDSSFRGKCFQKLHDLRQKGTSFILVSHNAHSILTICDAAVYLKKGEVAALGDTAEIINRYEEDLLLSGVGDFKSSVLIDSKSSATSNGLDIQSVFFRDGQGNLLEQPTSGQPMAFCVRCVVHRPMDKVGLSLVISGLSEGGETVLLLNSRGDDQELTLAPGTHEIQVKLPYLGLRLGGYVMDVFVKQDGLYHLDFFKGFKFKVKSKESIDRGLFYQPREWAVVSQTSSDSLVISHP